ncbi:aspartate aminotransferase family protein [Methyloligella sp. 2.7D]|uniref:aspartate aminotransferase family protein n=1 Tax=unclassified Methyloligella TaxID=2625955 RepID=UPI00157C2A91|nr:aspartate aminotransferase family protein [Methyloligella sp. GL2]QKP78505.1 aspartate aminotransferase family protein [Methyloligella sp. GL2]
MSALFPTYARNELTFARGEGAWLIDENDERYLDFGSGIAVTALGHCHPHLVEALTDQAQRLWHLSNLYQIPAQERLAERLCQASFADKVFFANSGAEAMECAIKTARRYHFATGNPERYRLIAFEGAFHGRTLATIAAGGQQKHLEGFGPPMPGFDHVPLHDLDAVKAAITEETAGIIIEPILGEGGLRDVTHRFLHELRDLCDEHGLLLIYDEVQSGMGRTGKLFAHQWAGVTPDIMGLAKGLGGGFPVAACLATDEAATGMTPGTHGSTFGGNPLAMAVGNAVLDVMLEPDFLPRVCEISLRFKQRLAAIKDEYPQVIEEVRGQGLMLGLKCTSSVSNLALVKSLIEERLLTVQAGDNVVRLLPPLIIGETEIDQACEKIEAACAALAPSVPAEA